mgnify:CR=1 FL=1
MLNKIKGRMRELGFTQNKMAERLRLSPVALNRKLTAKTEFKISEIVRIADILNVSAIDLVELQVKEERK